MDLKEFIRRGEVLRLYRQAMRLSMGLSDARVAAEIRAHVKSEFGKWRHERDPEKIKYLISLGKAEIKEMQTQVDILRMNMSVYGSASKR